MSSTALTRTTKPLDEMQSPYLHTRTWARHLHDNLAAIDGLAWRPRLGGTGISYVFLGPMQRSIGCSLANCFRCGRPRSREDSPDCQEAGIRDHRNVVRSLSRRTLSPFVPSSALVAETVLGVPLVTYNHRYRSCRPVCAPVTIVATALWPTFQKRTMCYGGSALRTHGSSCIGLTFTTPPN